MGGERAGLGIVRSGDIDFFERDQGDEWVVAGDDFGGAFFNESLLGDHGDEPHDTVIEWVRPALGVIPVPVVEAGITSYGDDFTGSWVDHNSAKVVSDSGGHGLLSGIPGELDVFTDAGEIGDSILDYSRMRTKGISAFEDSWPVGVREIVSFFWRGWHVFRHGNNGDLRFDGSSVGTAAGENGSPTNQDLELRKCRLFDCAHEEVENGFIAGKGDLWKLIKNLLGHILEARKTSEMLKLHVWDDVAKGHNHLR